MLEIYKNKKVWISGNTGFKGSWLSYWLLKLGAIVNGYSWLPSVSQPNHYDLLDFKKDSFNDSYNHDIGDICSYKDVYNSMYLFEPELVFHLAAMPLVITSLEKPIETFGTNIQGTVNVLEACREIKSVKNVVIITTDKVYKDRDDLYTRDFGYSENDELGGNLDPYSCSKSCVELIVNCYRESFFKPLNKGVATVRAGNVLGGGDWSDYRLIPDIIKSITNKNEFVLRNPSHVRPWNYILDVLYGYLLVGEDLMDSDSQIQYAWNFGPDINSNITTKELIDLVIKYYPEVKQYISISQGKNKFKESSYLKLNSELARTLLNWKPKFNIEQTIEQTMRWYKEYIENKNIITEKQIDEFSRNLR